MILDKMSVNYLLNDMLNSIKCSILYSQHRFFLYQSRLKALYKIFPSKHLLVTAMHLLANPQENLGVYPINHYTIPASVLVIIDHTQLCQNQSSSFPNSNSFLIYFFPRMCTILYDAKVGAVFMKGNLRRHTDAL